MWHAAVRNYHAKEPGAASIIGERRFKLHFILPILLNVGNWYEKAAEVRIPQYNEIGIKPNLSVLGHSSAWYSTSLLIGAALLVLL